MAQFHIETSLQNGVDRVFAFLPQLVGAIVILIVGHFIAKLIQRGVRRLLTRLRFDRTLNIAPGGRYLARMIESPTKLASRVTYWVLMLLFISFAVSTLNIPALNAIVVGIYAYIPKVVAAVIIFVIASAITGGAERFVQRVLGYGPTARIVGAIVPAITMSIAIFMVLNELQIAKDIVNITYTAIMAALALGLALAFGLGGRDVAAQMLNQAYEAAQRDQTLGSSSRPPRTTRRRGSAPPTL